jgi:hypothetical protein
MLLAAAVVTPPWEAPGPTRMRARPQPMHAMDRRDVA